MTTPKIILTLLFVAIGGMPKTSGCSCSKNPGPAEALKESAMVFEGKVLSKTAVDLPVILYDQINTGEMIGFQALSRRQVVTFKVLKLWKGRPSKTYVVLAADTTQPRSSGVQIATNCWPPFDVGKTYLVFAGSGAPGAGFSGGGYAEANLCAPTGPLDKAQSTVHELTELTAK